MTVKQVFHPKFLFPTTPSRISPTLLRTPLAGSQVLMKRPNLRQTANRAAAGKMGAVPAKGNIASMSLPSWPSWPVDWSVAVLHRGGSSAGVSCVVATGGMRMRGSWKGLLTDAWGRSLSCEPPGPARTVLTVLRCLPVAAPPNTSDTPREFSSYLESSDPTSP